MTWLNDSWKKRYKENIQNQIGKVDILERSTLLHKTNAVRKNVIPFLVNIKHNFPKFQKNY